MFFGQNFVFYKLLVDFCVLWTLGNHSKLNLKRWVIWNVILKDAGCSNGLIVNTQLHLCKLVLEFQELSDSDDWQCYLIISLFTFIFANLQRNKNSNIHFVCIWMLTSIQLQKLPNKICLSRKIEQSANSRKQWLSM